jgi:hypothetical protein
MAVKQNVYSVYFKFTIRICLPTDMFFFSLILPPLQLSVLAPMPSIDHCGTTVSVFVYPCQFTWACVEKLDIAKKKQKTTHTHTHTHTHGLRRSRTQENSYPGEFVPQKLGMTSPGEVVPGYDFSWRSRTQVQLLQEKS